jgi:hypothetical protein
MHTLSQEERQTLVAMIGELHGSALTYEAFADAMLGLFEDISGFETIPPATAKRIVLNLWSTYHGQEAREA